MKLCLLHYCPQPCEQCAHRKFLARVFPRSASTAPAVITFKEAVFEHIYHPWEQMHPIDNPQTLREECAKRGMYSEYLRDSTIWRAPPSRWI